MFEDVGKEIKNIAKTFIVLAMIPAVLIAIVVFAVLTTGGPVYMLLGLVLAIGIVVSTYFTARMMVVLLYGYGELIDRTKSIEEHIVPSKGNNQKVPRRVSVKTDVDVPKTMRNANGKWNCVFCEEENEADAKWCKNCNIEARFD